MKPKVSIIMGSTSDLKVMESAAKFFDELEIPFEMNALSAHRTPEKVEEFAKSARGRGVQVIIAGAGMAAHLPGVLASWTSIPVIGIPVPNGALHGIDALLSIIQMPGGVPVACMGIGKGGATNAALLAAQILGMKYDDIKQAYKKYKMELAGNKK